MVVISETPAAIKKWRRERDEELGYLGEDAVEIWRPWMQAVSEHRWLFVPESPCMNCGQLTTTMQAGEFEQTLCPECLNAGSPWYPTGWAMPEGTTYVKHSESCTSHSSYPTSSSSMRSEEMSMRLSMQSSQASSPTSTSSSAPQKPIRRTSLRAMRLSR